MKALVLLIPFLPGLVALEVGAGGSVLSIDPAASRITFTLQATLHEVEGSFDVVSGEIRFDLSTGTASGRIVVDATSGETGNDKRDKKMHRAVLRSADHPEIVFEPSSIVGRLNDSGPSRLTVVGTIRLLGMEHTVELPVEATIEGETARVRTTWKVPYVEWGLKDPSVFVLRVAKTVDVAIALTGRMSGPVRARGPGGE